MAQVPVDGDARVIGNYRLYGRIGSGGMGTVHLARFFAPGGFRRIVAIKRLHPQFAEDASFVTGFLEEARLASRIHHPNVVAPLDVVAERGEVSLVFEHVLGVSLSVLVRRAREQGEAVPTRIAASIMINVLHGLQAAHDAKGDNGEVLDLVHRDVSPQNVLVGRDGSARLLDFGIAKASGRSLTTDEGVVKGKRGYMAPEHLVNATSQASDIYSAAVVLWELIAERRLFPDDSSITQRLAGDAAPLPSTVARTALAAEDRDALDAITTRGLAHATAARYASADDMALALEVVGVASAREVGEWVERVAREDLAERRRLVELAEAPAGMPSPAVSEPSTGVIAVMHDEDATIGATVHAGARPRRGLLAGLAVVSVVIVGGVIVKSRTREPIATAPVAAVQPDAAVEEIEVTALPAAAVAPGGSASTEAKPAAAAVHPPKKRAAPCKPYVVDKDGRKQFNEACFR